MDDGPRAAQGLHGLAELRQVGDELLLVGRLGRAHEVDAQHLLAVLEEVAHDGPPGLAGPPVTTT